MGVVEWGSGAGGKNGCGYRARMGVGCVGWGQELKGGMDGGLYLVPHYLSGIPSTYLVSHLPCLVYDPLSHIFLLTLRAPIFPVPPDIVHVFLPITLDHFQYDRGKA